MLLTCRFLWQATRKSSKPRQRQGHSQEKSTCPKWTRITTHWKLEETTEEFACQLLPNGSLQSRGYPKPKTSRSVVCVFLSYTVSIRQRSHTSHVCGQRIDQVEFRGRGEFDEADENEHEYPVQTSANSRPTHNEMRTWVCTCSGKR